MKNYQAILIIEDDQTLAQTLANSFEKRGFQARVAQNLKEVSALLKKFHPTHALVDLKIASESGLQFIKILHEFDKTMKIVMLTGYASITTTIEAIKLGACYYLAKPANVDAIIAAFNGETAQEKIASENLSKKTSIKNIEHEYIHQTLAQTNFNISKAARLLGLHRKTLARKLAKKLF
jgi:two-component system response regulator RegA